MRRWLPVDIECRRGGHASTGGEIRQKLDAELEGGELNGVNLQCVTADEAQDAGNGLWRLDAARAAPEQAQAGGQDADAENESGELGRAEREFRLLLPDVDHHCD